MIGLGKTFAAPQTAGEIQCLFCPGSAPVGRNSGRDRVVKREDQVARVYVSLCGSGTLPVLGAKPVNAREQRP